MLSTLSRAIDAVSTLVGRLAAWGVVVAITISAGNAIIRKVLGQSSNAWLEAQWYLFGMVFLLCAAWTHSLNEHVRIDIVSGMLSRRARVRMDLVLNLMFLAPFVAVLLWLSVPWAWESFQRGEMSNNAGGLILWPAKAMVPAGFALLALQCLSQVIKRAAELSGREVREPPGGKPL